MAGEMAHKALSFVKQNPLLTIGAAAAVFFSSPAIVFFAFILSPILIPAAALAAVSWRMRVYLGA